MATAQLDMFAPAADEPFSPEKWVVYPDAGRVRQRLSRMLDELAAATGPLNWDRRRYVETVVPQMSLALPEDEAAQVRLEFARELERLG